MSASKRLIRDYEDYVPGSLGDDLWFYARAIETSLIETGAVAGKDYTYMDLYRLAMKHIQSTIISKTIDKASEKFESLGSGVQDVARAIENRDD